MKEFIDASVFLGMHSKDERTRVAYNERDIREATELIFPSKLEELYQQSLEVRI